MYGAVVSSSWQDVPHDIQMIDAINAAIFGAMAVDNVAQDCVLFLGRDVPC